MHELSLSAVGLAALVSFAAGFIDAVVGGGGLLTTPALLLLFPEMPVAQVLGTTKSASIVGTTAAAATYARRLSLPLRRLGPACLAAAVAAWAGARSVSHLNPEFMRPGILVLLVVMAVYTAFKPDLGRHGGVTVRPARLGLMVTAVLLGFYDGFFGPGTGSILVMVLIVGFGFDFLTASGAAKFINGASNVGALAYFMPTGAVNWTLALPMALCNFMGGLLGSRVAMASGNAWVRRVFLAVVIALILRLGYGLLAD